MDGLGVRFFKANKNLVCLLDKSSEVVPCVTTKIGLVTSGDQFSDDPIFTEKVIENFGCVPVIEMEGASMAQVAYLNNIPFAIVRGISDRVDSTASDTYNEFATSVPKYYSKLMLEFIKCYY